MFQVSLDIKDAKTRDGKTCAVSGLVNVSNGRDALLRQTSGMLAPEDAKVIITCLLNASMKATTARFTHRQLTSKPRK